jgi:hypothetical protein
MHYVEHNCEIGDRCPWSLHPAPATAEPGNEPCPARCPDSAIDLDDDELAPGQRGGRDTTGSPASQDVR